MNFIKRIQNLEHPNLEGDSNVEGFLIVLIDSYSIQEYHLEVADRSIKDYIRYRRSVGEQWPAIHIKNFEQRIFNLLHFSRVDQICVHDNFRNIETIGRSILFYIQFVFCVPLKL